MIYDVVVIGGGQAGLACGYYLRRAGLTFLILDEQQTAGGAWSQTWDSLTLFTPTEYSSLPGWLMPRSDHPYPTRDETLRYLAQYEVRYQLPIQRPVLVTSVRKTENIFTIEAIRSSQPEVIQAHAVISATGTWHHPYIPSYPGVEQFEGEQLHSAFYKEPSRFRGKNVLIIGEGNSGAQILAEVSTVAATTWITKNPPQFLPDNIDGRILFQQASTRYHAIQEGNAAPSSGFAGIVMTPALRSARERGVLHSYSLFARFTARGIEWEDGTYKTIDAVIWCTGFKASLDHLTPLALYVDGRIPTEGSRVIDCAGLWLVGYGNWTGFASGTMIGAGRSAKKTVEEIQQYLPNS